MDEVYEALTAIRAPLATGEYDLHALVRQALEHAGVPCVHEAKLAPRCRIDFLCGTVGVEIKKGKPVHTDLIRQLSRYAACPEVSGLIAVTERNTDLPHFIGGKPVRGICLNRLWGIAL